MVRTRCALLLAALVVAGSWRPAPTAPPETVARPRAAAEGPALYLGAGSCAAAACHGSKEHTGPAWSRAYTEWITRDPHARAAAILFDDCSRQMVARLEGLSDPSQAKPHKDARCLACHATVGPSDLPAGTLAADGVSCESCHGPAQRWLSLHVTDTWKQLPAAQRYHSQTGLVPTKDLAGRARQCVGCHVGAPARDGIPKRAVDHDLIAAGHPPLRFEFSGYLSQLPRHWDDRADRRRADSHAARAWSVGQATSAAAFLDLVADDAAAVRRQGGAAPWPEFAHFDCFACHQQLRGRVPAAETLLVGRNRLAPWYQLGPQVLRARVAPLAADSWGELAAALAASRPDPAQIERLARAAADERRALAHRVSAQQHAPSTQVEYLTALFDAVPKEGPTWDQGVQAYRAALAAVEARVESRPRGQAFSPTAEREIRARLAGLRGLLAFPAAEGPGERPCAEGVFGTPAAFDPQQALGEIAGLVELLAP